MSSLLLDSLSKHLFSSARPQPHPVERPNENPSIITVPCPGADPLETWSRDALVENYFGTPSMRSSTRTSDLRDSQTSGGTGGSGKSYGTTAVYKISSPSWVRLGIRKEASKARVLMYEHQDIVEGTTLNVLAEDLLREVLEIRLMQVGLHDLPIHLHFSCGTNTHGRMRRAPSSSSVIAWADWS